MTSPARTLRRRWRRELEEHSRRLDQAVSRWRENRIEADRLREQIGREGDAVERLAQLLGLTPTVPKVEPLPVRATGAAREVLQEELERLFCDHGDVFDRIRYLQDTLGPDVVCDGIAERTVALRVAATATAQEENEDE